VNNTPTTKTLADSLGIEFLELTPNKVSAKMPVDERTKQPFGILHGGASAALIETVASIGSVLNINQDTDIAVGTELHCQHLESARSGFVIGTATPIRLGKSIHVWQVDVRQEGSDKLICRGTCSLFVKRGGGR
jgi:1,4-dihydroxy-2-naphthoyl-CoA hydrolase